MDKDNNISAVRRYRLGDAVGWGVEVAPAAGTTATPMILPAKLRQFVRQLIAPADKHLSSSQRKRGQRFWLGMLYTGTVGYLAVLPVP